MFLNATNTSVYAFFNFNPSDFVEHADLVRKHCEQKLPFIYVEQPVLARLGVNHAAAKRQPAQYADTGQTLRSTPSLAVSIQVP